MITDDEVLTLFQRADPARVDEHNNVLDATGYLDALQTRSNNVTTIETTPNQNNRPDRRRLMLTGVAAALVVVIVVGAFVFAARDDSGEPQVPATTPTTPTTPTTTTPTTPTTTPTTPTTLPFGSEEALSVTDAYFAANSAADFEALHALLTPDATFTGQFYIASDEQLLAWNAAQGTKLSEPDCNVSNELPGESATVTCTFFNLDALVQAVDGPPVEITLRLTVTPNGISDEFGAFGQPDFNTVAAPFDSWMAENHPEDQDRVGFSEWASIEEAEANGTLTAEYAQEWATYLEANECTYRDGC